MITLKRIIIWVITLVFAATFIFSAIQIINYISNAKENEDIAKEIAEEISEEISDKISGNNAEDDKKSVDFSSLKAMNSDTVGYLKVNGTNVESAVVQAKDNSYYLSHNFKKNYNKAGWIFADYRNRFDGTDKNIVIYGHNMKNGSMFSSLKNILTANWQEHEENMNVILVTERGVSNYRVFSVYQIEDEDYYTTVKFDDNSSFKSFINKLKLRSQKNFNVDVKINDQILTLSTCADNNDYRIVLHAVKL